MLLLPDMLWISEENSVPMFFRRKFFIMGFLLEFLGPFGSISFFPYYLLSKVGFLTVFESWTFSPSHNNVKWIKNAQEYKMNQLHWHTVIITRSDGKSDDTIFQSSCEHNFEILRTTVIGYENIIDVCWWQSCRYVHTIVVACDHNGRERLISVSS